MTNNRITRASLLAVVLAAGALAGCSTPPSAMIVSQNAMAPSNTGPYSSDAWYSDLDIEMTSMNGGD
ncbi:MAG TPA: hypothetical protein VHY80_11740 [Stellaceae bacterium]|nr:hypothetical protein [Stellaceae bacterium]